ncbi:MAG: hypothetical protein ACK5JT_22310 [Hyphomicrobiaceae bacterium]
MTLPNLMPFNDYGGDWGAYELALYQVFERDIIHHDLQFQGLRVNARRLPEHARKWACFWHLISEGRLEDERTPDLRRCERLPLVRWIVENAASHTDIDMWEQVRGHQRNWLLWHEEYQLVVLEQRNDYYLLKTAFCTEQNHRVRKFRRERDAYLRAAP